MNNFPNYFSQVAANFDGPHMQMLRVNKLRFLQIGVYTGDASTYLLDKFIEVKDFVLFDVDTWQSGDSKEMQEMDFLGIEEFYLNRTKQYRESGKLRVFKSTSDLFFANNIEKFDFVYVDGNHEPLQILKDGLNSFECLELGGILAFDDYQGATNKISSERPKYAIDAFLDFMDGKVEVIIDNYQLWVRKVAHI